VCDQGASNLSWSWARRRAAAFGAARLARNELALARKVRERFPETPQSHVNADPIEPLTATLGPMSLMQSRVSRDESVASRGYV
jgi:hypothetical protein